MKLEHRAMCFATAAHAGIGQKRKYTGEDYIVHPGAVARLVRGVGHDEAMLAAAWLHDTVEDTAVTLQEIDRTFGADVAALVDWLTDVSRLEDGNREMRKALDRLKSSMAPARAQTIKVADLIDNSKTIFKHDPHFARVYLREKEALLDVLTKANPELVSIAKQQLQGYTGIIH